MASHIAIDDVSITSGECQENTTTPALPTASASLLPSSLYSMLSTDKPTSTPSLRSSQSAFKSSTIKPSPSSSVLSGIVNVQMRSKAFIPNARYTRISKLLTYFIYPQLFKIVDIFCCLTAGRYPSNCVPCVLCAHGVIQY